MNRDLFLQMARHAQSIEWGLSGQFRLDDLIARLEANAPEDRTLPADCDAFVGAFASTIDFTPLRRVRILERISPVLINTAQTTVSFAVAGPVLNNVAQRLIGDPALGSGGPQWPAWVNVGGVLLLSFVDGMVVNGMQGLKGFPILPEIVQEGVKGVASILDNVGEVGRGPRRWLRHFYEEGLNGVNIQLDQSLPQSAFGGLTQQGRALAWMNSVAYSTVAIPVFAWASGMGWHPEFLLSGALMAGLHTLSTVRITLILGPKRPALANLVRSGFSFARNSVSTLTSPRVLGASLGLGLQVAWCGAAYLASRALFREKPRQGRGRGRASFGTGGGGGLKALLKKR